MLEFQSQNPAYPLKLESHHVHLWRISLAEYKFVSEYWPLLSKEEAQKANAFRFSHHRDRYILGRGAVRHILSQYCSLSPTQVTFQYTPHQKPFLANNSLQLQFNLSHSNQLGLLGVTKTYPIGVDVEIFRPLKDLDALAQQFFSKAEARIFLTLPEDQKLEMFYTIWTRKEAFVKAIGEGLTYPLDQFDLTFLPHLPAKIIRIKNSVHEGQKWFLKGLSFSDHRHSYIGAYALKNTPQKLFAFQYAFIAR
jgi:4'-phosphopantetheinyl transferase